MYLLQFSAVFLESSAMENIYEVLKFVYFLLYKKIELNWITFSRIKSTLPFQHFLKQSSPLRFFFQIHFQSNLNKSFIMSTTIWREFMLEESVPQMKYKEVVDLDRLRFVYILMFASLCGFWSHVFFLIKKDYIFFLLCAGKNRNLWKLKQFRGLFSLGFFYS